MMRRSIIAAVAALAASAALVPAAPAQEIAASAAINCGAPILPNGAGGVTIYVAGQPVRVPKVEDLYVCVRSTNIYTDTAPVKTYYGCGATCFSVYSPAGLQSGTVTTEACYTADGVRRCLGGSTPIYVSGPSRCLVSVGQPAQHTPSGCLIVVDQDTLIGGVVG